MIYVKQTIKELTINAISIFAIIFVILFCSQLVNLLGKISKGSLTIDMFGIMSSLTLISLTPLMMILTIYISIFTVMNRYWRDFEMQIWLSSGLSLFSFLRPILLFSVPLVIITAFLSLSLVPWANTKGENYINIIKQKPNISFFEQGVFFNSREGVFFFEKYNPSTGDIINLFSRKLNLDSGIETITLSKFGQIYFNNNKFFLSLKDAKRYIGNVNDKNYILIDIPTAKIELDLVNQEIVEDKIGPSKLALTKTLINNMDNAKSKAILFYRLSMPLTALILSLIAIGLSYYNTRTGRTYNTILALLLFILYQLLIVFARNGILKSNFNIWFCFIGVHLLMFILALYLINRRIYPK